MRYRFWIPQHVRFRDLDTFGHVNHIIYFVYAEMVRVEYYRQVLGLGVEDLAFLMLDIHCHYFGAAEYGQELRLGFRVDWLKRSSSGFSFFIEGPGGRPLGEGDGIQVYVDRATMRAVPLPDALRAKIRDFEGQVEER